MDQLYQEQILALARVARDCKALDAHTHHASLSNPVCGDRVDIRINLVDGRIDALSAEVRGCALCEAGAGLLINIADKKNADDFRRLGEVLTKWLAGQDDAAITESMGAFAPVRDIRSRQRCVTLAFEAGRMALDS